jgi:hypothetical protein
MVPVRIRTLSPIGVTVLPASRSKHRLDHHGHDAGNAAADTHHPMNMGKTYRRNPMHPDRKKLKRKRLRIPRELRRVGINAAKALRAARAELQILDRIRGRLA